MILSQRHYPAKQASRLCLLVALLAMLLVPDVCAQLTPRVPLDLGAVKAPVVPASLLAKGLIKHRLVLKLADGLQGRATGDGGLDSEVGASLSGLEVVAADESLRFAPLLRTGEEQLNGLLTRAAERSGRAQPDLAGLLIIELPGGADAAPGTQAVTEMVRVSERIRALPEVEFVALQTLGVPPPGDIAPTTTDLTPNQLYLQPDPGFDIEALWAQGFDGSGIRLSDCEFGWNPAHEDLVDHPITAEPGQTIHPDVQAMGWDDHGTAVLGVTSAGINGYGFDGLASGATVFTYPEMSLEEGDRRETAIANALADSSAGDVVLLEMQALGPDSKLAPAEVDPTVFMLTRVGVDAGIIVVAAAGNGTPSGGGIGANLDSAIYFDYRAMGDSGAIIVGAGQPDVSHDKMPFSTFGSRVNVQGWGNLVATLGYGDFLMFGGDENQAYTNSFNGTSSASAFIGAICCLIQEAAVSLGGARLSPGDLRYLLSTTGVPQGAGGHIGPHPDMSEVLARLPQLFEPRWQDLGGGTLGQNGIPSLVGVGELTPGSPLGLTLTGGTPGALAFLWLSGGSSPGAFLGGTLHAYPFFSQVVLVLDGAGSVSGSQPFPPGLMPGTQIWYQMGLVDSSVASYGGVLSNAVVSMTP